MAFLVINHKTWEQQNREQILSIKSDADGLLSSSRPKQAYDRYRDLFSFVGQHEIHNEFLKSELQRASAAMNEAKAQAAPLIAKEEAEAREREAEQQRIADQQRAAELAQKEKQEAERQQQEAARARADAEAREEARIAQATAAQRAQKAAARALFLNSDEFATWKRQADAVVGDMTSDLIGEDSMYRGLSKRAKACRNLLGLYVKAEGRLLGVSTDAPVDRILSAADMGLITEDSAIRAIYENDKAFFEVLEPLCTLLDGKDGGLERTYDTQSRTASLAGIGDDSAIRAIDTYSGASMEVLHAIVSNQGLGPKADAIVSRLQIQDIAEDSAWRSAMRNKEGSMDLLLLLVAQENPAAATKIESDVRLAVVSDDSALRAQEMYIEGEVGALHWLVDHP